MSTWWFFNVFDRSTAPPDRPVAGLKIRARTRKIAQRKANAFCRSYRTKRYAEICAAFITEESARCA